MSFPTSPTNGQIAVVNNVAYEYASANTSWTRVLSIANIIQANVISANVLNVVQEFSITGNIATGNYFIGNGAFLTGLAATYSNANVASYLPVYTGNLVSLTGPVTTTGNITANNVLFGTGVVSGTGTVYATTVSTTGNVNSGYISTGQASVGNLISGGYVSATGNITGNYILGNGALLTGVITSVANINSGTSNVTVVSSGGNITVGVGGTDNVAVFGSEALTIKGNILPGANVTYDLGTSTQRWRDLWLSNSTIYLGNAQIAANATAITITNPAGGTTVLQGSTPSITGSVVTASGNITGGNLLTGGLISSTGTVTGSSLIGAVVTASGNVTGGNMLTSGAVSATGNVTGGNINSNTVIGTALTLKSTGALNISSTGNIILASNVAINNVGYPQQDADAATKLYVDNLVTTGFSFHQPVTAATTTTLATATGGTITYSQPNGVANGVGAKLTTTGTFNLIDTANVQTIGTRILVKNEANTVWNGVYTWANATAIVRSLDTDEYGPDSTSALSLNDYFFTSGGFVNEGTSYIVSAPSETITFGTSGIEFSQFSSSQIYDAGTGLTLTGTTFSVNASQTQITSVGTLGSLAVTSNITGGNLLTGGLISAASTVTGTTITGSTLSSTGNVNTVGIVGTGNISTTGNISGGNILGGSNVNATTHTGSTVSVTSTVTGSQFNGSGAGLTSIPGANVSGTVANATYATSAGTVTTAAQANITSVGVLTSLSVSGNVTGGNVITTGSGGNITGANVISGTTISTTQILNAGANGIGNIGNSTTYFNTVFAKATSAQYADLAEEYISDTIYTPGTVLIFGGNNEVTIATEPMDPRIAGVVSTNPAHVMNAGAHAGNIAVVALTGRVPTSVVGTVRKGDMMVSAGNGTACACTSPAIGTVIGKALENFDGKLGVIEVVVGRL